MTVVLVVLFGLLADASSSVGASNAVAPARPIRWLAVGDSYSSGEGLADVAEPSCQRADGTGGHLSTAWAVKAREQLGADTLPIAADSGNRKGFDFEACTGAVTLDLFEANNGKQEWSSDGNGRFDLVTFSFGGNNVGFSDLLLQCLGFSKEAAAAAAAGGEVGGTLGAARSWAIARGCPSESPSRQKIADLVTPDPLDHGNDYRSFLRRVANDLAVEGGNVIVVGYPNFIEDPKFWPTVNQASGLCQGIKSADARMIRGLAGDLNKTIADAVADVDRDHPRKVHFTFVDVNTGQPDHGTDFGDSNLFEPNTGARHNLCAGEPWLNGLTTGWNEAWNGRLPRPLRSFHPTQNGHDHVGQLVAARIRGLDWSSLGPSDLVAQTPSSPGRPPGSIECGHDPANNQWDVVASNITCEEALRIMALYDAAPDKQGSSGYATVDGFSCGSDSLPVFPFDSYGSCTKDRAAVYVYPAAPTTNPSPAGWVITTDGVGPIKIGMTPDEAAKASGLSLSKGGCSGAWSLGDGTRSFLLVSYAADTRIQAITSSDPSITTKSGGRIGMTTEQVRAVLGNNVESGRVQSGDVLIVHSANKSREVIFSFVNDKVSDITTGTAEVAGIQDGGC